MVDVIVRVRRRTRAAVNMRRWVYAATVAVALLGGMGGVEVETAL